MLAGLATPVRAQDLFADLTIGRACRAFAERKARENATLVLGHLSYAEDPATRRSTCGWSTGSAWGAFTACRRQAEKDGVPAVCRPVIRDSVVVARSYAEAAAPPGRFACDPASDALDAARELLPARPGMLALAGDGAFAGTWYGLLGETVVAVSAVRAPGGSTPSVLYRWATSSGAGGAVYPVTREAGQLSFTLSTRSTITMRPAPGELMTVTWQGAQQASTNFSASSGPAVTTLAGDFGRAPDEL